MQGGGLGTRRFGQVFDAARTIGHKVGDSQLGRHVDTLGMPITANQFVKMLLGIGGQGEGPFCFVDEKSRRFASALIVSLRQS